MIPHNDDNAESILSNSEPGRSFGLQFLPNFFESFTCFCTGPSREAWDIARFFDFDFSYSTGGAALKCRGVSNLGSINVYCIM